MVRRRSSGECRSERLRRSAARTDRGAPSPLRRESATSALSEDERGGNSGPGIGKRREILPRVERGISTGDGSPSQDFPRRSGLGSRGVPCLLGVCVPAGDEVERFNGEFEVNGVKNGVDGNLSLFGVRGGRGASMSSVEDAHGFASILFEDSAGVTAIDGTAEDALDPGRGVRGSPSDSSTVPRVE